MSVTQVVSCRCQIQALLRLELCRLFSSPEQADSLDADQMAEEVGCSLFITALLLCDSKDSLFLKLFSYKDELYLAGCFCTFSLTGILNKMKHSIHLIGK